MTSAETPALAPRSSRTTARFFLLFAGVLFLSMAARFAIVYNFQFFCFYDPGTAFHGLSLMDPRPGYPNGLVPTVDFGYTHGLLSLEFSRLWLNLFGRHPIGFVLGVFALQLVIAWGLARLAKQFDLSRRATILFCCLLPWASTPEYLTLTHPLEAAFIIHALAFHAEGRRSIALMLLTICVFVKPSMSYVYGFVLTLLILRDTLSREDLYAAGKFKKLLRQLAPAAIAGVLCLAFCLWRYGPLPTKNTLLALAGAGAYKETHFGIFTADGRSFWLPTLPPQYAGVGVLDFILYYIFNPAGIWLISVITLIILGFFYLTGFFSRPLRRPLRQSAAAEIFVTLFLLHSAFVFVFYGFSRSWTYYAYMPFFALVLAISRLNVHKKIVYPLIALAALCHYQAFTEAKAIWQWGIRTPETNNFYAWENHAISYKEILAQVGTRRTLIMTNGYFFNLPPNIEMPDAWFPESGIAIAPEIDRVAKQAFRDDMQCVIVFHPAGKADLWWSPKFDNVRAEYERVPLEPKPKFPEKNEDGTTGPPFYRNSHFELWVRKDKP